MKILLSPVAEMEHQLCKIICLLCVTIPEVMHTEIGQAHTHDNASVGFLDRRASLDYCLPSCSNDAFDAAMGVDGAKAESVVNLTGNRQGVLWTANAALVAGGFLLWHVIRQIVGLSSVTV